MWALFSRRRFFVASGVAAIALAGILIILLILNAVWQHDKTTRLLERGTINGQAAGSEIQITYPRHLLLGEAPASVWVDFSARPEVPFEEPIILTLVGAPGIQQTSTLSQVTSLTATLVFSPAAGINQQAQLLWANAGIGDTKQTARVLLSSTANHVFDKQEISIALEAPSEAAWRQFRLAMFNDRGAFVLAVPILLSLGAFVLNLSQQMRTSEKEDEATAGTVVATVRAHLVQGEGKQAVTVWNSFKESGKSPPPQSKWLEHLVRIATEGLGNPPTPETDTTLTEILAEWPDEACGALLSARETIIQSKPHHTIYRKFILEFPRGRVKDRAKLSDLTRLYKDIGGEPLQEPIPLIRYSLPKKYHTTPLIGLDRNPFPATQAESDSEANLLLGHHAFWKQARDNNLIKHVAYHRVQEYTDHQLIYGLRGCGRTALVWQLADKDTPSQITIHVPIQPNSPSAIEVIEQAVARWLLDYVLAKPTLLLSLSETERHWLATILNQKDINQPLRIRLERAVENAAWLSQADPGQKEVWKQVGRNQLNLLASAVPPEKILLTGQWLKDAFDCLQLLFNFATIRLAIEFPFNHVDLVKKYLSELRPGWPHRQAFFLFLATVKEADLIEVRGAAADVNVKPIALSWTAEQLNKLVYHRFLTIAGESFPFRFFEGESVDVDTWCHSSQTPQQLVEIWQAALDSLPPGNEQIPTQVLLDAIQEVKERWYNKS